MRVLLVHDSPTVRASLKRTIESAPGARVVAELDHARDVVAAIERYQPAVVVMDVVMPDVDGFEATRRIMASRPVPIVLVSSVVDPRDAAVALDAIRAGALAIVDPPPADPGSHRREAFLALLRSAAGVRPKPAPRASPAIASRARRPARVIGIVASTGGPAALSSVLEALPRGAFPPLLVVQHLAKGFAEGLTRWLATTGQRVELAEHGRAAARGVVYVAPEDRHLGIDREGRLVVASDPPIKQFRPSGSFLLRSIGVAAGSAGAGIVLTGMGDDGAEGALALRRAGGEVIAQDEASSVVYGMPRAAVACGAAEEVVPLTEVARWIVEKTGA